MLEWDDQNKTGLKKKKKKKKKKNRRKKVDLIDSGIGPETNKTIHLPYKKEKSINK